jgi:uncharacterized delta-60 repeat protein
MRCISALTWFCRRTGKPFIRCTAVCLASALLTLSSAHLLITTRAAAGDFDTAFGNGGKVVADLFGQLEVATAVALQSDGKIVVAGYTAPLTAPAARSDFALARYNADGTFDTSFGNNGKVMTDFDATHQDQAKAVAIQSDGKIIAAGFTSFLGSDDNTDYAFALARYNPDGTLDPSFGSNGKVVTNNANPTGFNIYYRESINALAIQNDGKIVATGTAFLNPAQSMDFTTIRYNRDGSIDTAFGTSGRVFTNFTNTNPAEPNDSAGEVFVQGNGKILVAGRVHHLSFEYGIARYNADGSLDSTFGQGGLMTTNYPRQASGNASKETAMAVQSDGKIIIGGFAQANDGNHCALSRFDANGNLDTTFGTSGQVATRLAGAIRSVKIQSNGKIIAAGDSPENAGDFAIMRYTTNGSLDESFGNGGTITTDFSGNADQLFALAIQSDGKIVAVGATATSTGQADFALARYLSGDAQAGTRYDLCVQDDESKNYLEINSTTGEYLLTRCDFNWLAGTGVISKDATTFTLTDESAGQAVSVSINLAKHKAQITIRTFSPNLKTKIKDRNIDDNSCSCR